MPNALNQNRSGTCNQLLGRLNSLSLFRCRKPHFQQLMLLERPSDMLYDRLCHPPRTDDHGRLEMMGLRPKPPSLFSTKFVHGRRVTRQHQHRANARQTPLDPPLLTDMVSGFAHVFAATK
jgi:hypothetical protein